MPLPCEHSANGCPRVLAQQNYPEHIAQCQFREFTPTQSEKRNLHRAYGDSSDKNNNDSIVRKKKKMELEDNEDDENDDHEDISE